MIVEKAVRTSGYAYPLRLETAILREYVLEPAPAPQVQTEKLLQDLKEYFTPMAERTGTLWEHDQPSASCCHGFASHVLYWLAKIYGTEKTQYAGA